MTLSNCCSVIKSDLHLLSTVLALTRRTETEPPAALESHTRRNMHRVICEVAAQSMDYIKFGRVHTQKDTADQKTMRLSHGRLLVAWWIEIEMTRRPAYICTVCADVFVSEIPSKLLSRCLC